MQRRRYFRLATSIHPRRVIALGDDAPHVTADQLTILDLSGGGMLARMEGPTPEDDAAYRISFVLDGEPIDVNAVVSWSRPLPHRTACELGMRFDGLTPRMQVAVLDHIRRNQIHAAG